MIFLPLILILVVVVWGISQYNFFVSTKARIKASIQEIGNQLKRQVELIPNLESSAKGFLKHEKELFKMLTDARKQLEKAISTSDINFMSEAGDQMSRLIPRLQVAVEDNPEIKSADIISKLMEELRDTSDKVMYARRLLIDLSADYNQRRASFPSNLIANMFGFKEEEGLRTPMGGQHLSVSEDDTKTPKVEL